MMYTMIMLSVTSLFASVIAYSCGYRKARQDAINIATQTRDAIKRTLTTTKATTSGWTILDYQEEIARLTRDKERLQDQVREMRYRKARL